MDQVPQRRRPTNDTIRLDKIGNWYHGDYPILHDRTVQFLHRNIAVDKNGKFYLTGEDKPLYFEVEDVAYFIKKIERTIAGYLITLNDESIELLDLTTLGVGGSDVLYCLVKGGSFVAKFYRAPYSELTKALVQEGKKFFIQFGSKQFEILKQRPKPVVEEPSPSSKKSQTKSKPVQKKPPSAKKTATPKPKAKPAKKTPVKKVKKTKPQTTKGKKPAPKKALLKKAAKAKKKFKGHLKSK